MEDGYVIIGAGGHAKIVLDILKLNRLKICGLTDATLNPGDTCLGFPILGNDEILSELYSKGVRKAVIGIGHVGYPEVRNNLYYTVKQLDFSFPNVIHPTAIIADTVKMGNGNLLGANCTVNPDSNIGDLCIINTGAILEHDVKIGNGVHIAPHATVLGMAQIEDNTFVGAGSVILQGIHIGTNCIIGAGSIVIEDVENDSVVVGNPGRLIKRR